MASMTKDELFELYGRVQKKDRSAEDALIAEFIEVCPRGTLGHTTHRTMPHYRINLHAMYNYLYRIAKK